MQCCEVFPLSVTQPMQLQCKSSDLSMLVDTVGDLCLLTSLQTSTCSIAKLSPNYRQTYILSAVGNIKILARSTNGICFAFDHLFVLYFVSVAMASQTLSYKKLICAKSLPRQGSKLSPNTYSICSGQYQNPCKIKP